MPAITCDDGSDWSHVPRARRTASRRRGCDGPGPRVAVGRFRRPVERPRRGAAAALARGPRDRGGWGSTAGARRDVYGDCCEFNHWQTPRLRGFCPTRATSVSRERTSPLETSVETIDPDRAAAMLANNPANRPLVERRVATLVHAIQNGQWKLTHQGIAVTASGQLLDGQHRLAAIARAGQAVPMLVAVLDEDVFDVIDTGRARGPRDALALAGVTHAQRLPAAMRLVRHYRGPSAGTMMTGGSAPAMTNRDFLTMAEQQGEFSQLAPTAERAAVSVGRRGLVTGVLAAMVVIQQDAPAVPDSRAEFWNRLADPVMLTENSPILALRRWLTVTVPTETRGRGQLTMYGTIRAWNAYVEGRPLGRISVQLERSGAPVISAGRTT